MLGGSGGLNDKFKQVSGKLEQKALENKEEDKNNTSSNLTDLIGNMGLTK